MLLGCYTDPNNAISNVSKIIYFNQNHPENHNVRSVPSNPKYLQIRINGKWNYKNTKIVRDAISKCGFDILETRYGECHEDMNKNEQQEWDDYYFEYMSEEPHVLQTHKTKMDNLIQKQSKILFS